MDQPETVSPPRPRPLLRLLLGQLQIAGSIAGILLLLMTGVNAATITIAAATGIISLLSRFLFRQTR